MLERAMTFARSERREKVNTELRSRVAALREWPLEQLAALPEAKTESAQVAGRTVKFTVFREPQPDGGFLIAIRSDEPVLFGLITMGATEGFLVTPDGAKREAPEKLMREY